MTRKGSDILKRVCEYVSDHYDEATGEQTAHILSVAIETCFAEESALTLKLRTDGGLTFEISEDDYPEIYDAFAEWTRTVPRSSREHGAWSRLLELADEYLSDIGVEDDFTDSINR